MADKITPFDEYALKLYKPTQHETRMLIHALSGDTRFEKVQTWAAILEYIKTAGHVDVTVDAFRNVWLSYAAYRRRNRASI